MIKYISQNKYVLLSATALFVVSMSTLLFFFGNNMKASHNQELQTDVMQTVDIKSLQEDENKYRKLLNNEQDPIVVLNLDGTVDFTSGDIESILGYKQNELSHQMFLLLMNPEDIATFMGAFGTAIQTEKPVTTVGPYRIRDKNGQYHINIGSAVPVIDNGKIVKIAISTRDITNELEKTDGQNDKNDPKGSTQEKEKPKGKKIINEKNGGNEHLLADKKI